MKYTEIYTPGSRLTKSLWLLKDFVNRENFVNRDHSSDFDNLFDNRDQSFYYG